MSFNRAQNALDLLGQARSLRCPDRLPSRPQPQLEIAWGSFRQSLASSVRALLARHALSKKSLSFNFFRDCRIERSIPLRALLAAALWHVVFIVMPFSAVSLSPHRNPAFEDVQLTWSGPIDDLPLIEIPKARPQLKQVEMDQPPPVPEADAFHPRQRIFTDPLQPTHPRQTLINRTAPIEPPKILPNLPNMVQLEPVSAPVRPRLEINDEVLKKIRPRERPKATATSAPLPDVFNAEKHIAEISLSVPQNAPPQPKLELNAGAAPRLAKRAQAGDAGPAPDVGAPQANAANGSPTPLIALSATPAPPVPVAPPKGNLEARVSMSPEGKPGKAGSGGSDASGKGDSSVGVSVRAGNPPPGKGISGLGDEKISVPAPHRLITRIDPQATSNDSQERTGPPDFAALPAGAKPEQIFGSKSVYSMNVNMPNLNSATGSWILNFSELGTRTGGPHISSPELSGPTPVKKVDPKYPPSLVSERIEGEVILYAVIRRDGSVDSIQLVRGIDDQLNANAMNALAQWKFRPATKQNMPIELEAIVHIPFRLPELQ
jgi:TonB family protein